MSVKVTVTPGVDAAVAKMQAVKEAEAKAARAIAERARSIAPVGTAAEDDRHPGAYRASIHADGSAVIADVGHASFVEFGVPSRGIKAQYVFRRAASSLGYKLK